MDDSAPILSELSPLDAWKMLLTDIKSPLGAIEMCFALLTEIAQNETNSDETETIEQIVDIYTKNFEGIHVILAAYGTYLTEQDKREDE